MYVCMRSSSGYPASHFALFLLLPNRSPSHSNLFTLQISQSHSLTLQKLLSYSMSDYILSYNGVTPLELCTSAPLTSCNTCNNRPCYPSSNLSVNLCILLCKC